MSDIIATREQTHGPWNETARISQQLKTFVADELKKRSQFTGPTMQQREAIDAICTKLARILAGNPAHRDHWADISGYAELGAKDCGE